MAFGYYAEPTKSILVVKPEHQQQAEEIIGNLQIKITTSSRFLGGCIGDEEGVKEFVSEKVGVWAKGIGDLFKAARAYPHSAYCALNRSLSAEWSYLQRVTSG